MPIINYIPVDPFDVVMQGEQMRQSVFDSIQVADVVMLSGMQTFQSGLQDAEVEDEDQFAPMNSFVEGNLLSMRRLKSGALQMRNNAGIVSPCGAWIFLDYTPLINPFEQASVQWAISGITKDSAGAALGNCSILAMETGRLPGDGNIDATVNEAISDGSGNYSIGVPMNTAYQLTAYKPGAPDVAGITRNDVTPTAIG